MSREIISGARAKFLINGAKVGGATGVSIDENINYEPLEEMDNIEVSEWVPTGYTCSMRCQQVRIAKDDVVKAGWMPAKGNSHETFLANLLKSGDLAAVIEDSKTGVALETLSSVKTSGRSVNYTARGIVSKDLTFVVIRNRTESDT